MDNTNCNYCDSCDSCNSCNYCNSCNSCNSCNYCNSCDYCKGLSMSENMLFCLGEGGTQSEGEGYQKNYRVFNEQLTKDEWNKVKVEFPIIKLPIVKNTKRYTYEEAWKEWWKNAEQEDKNKILDCKYFDPKIFFDITGIDIKNNN